MIDLDHVVYYIIPFFLFIRSHVCSCHSIVITINRGDDDSAYIVCT